MQAGMEGICEIGRTARQYIMKLARGKVFEPKHYLPPDMTCTSTLVKEGKTSPGQSTMSTSDVQ